MSESLHVRRSTLLRRVVRGIAVLIIVFMAVALIADIVSMISALAGAGLTVSLPAHISGSVVQANGSGDNVPAPLPIVSAVSLTIEHAPPAVIVLNALAAILGGAAVGSLAFILLTWLKRVETGQPFVLSLSRVLFAAAIALAAGWLVADVFAWVVANSLAGTRFHIGSRMYATTGELFVPDITRLCLAGVLAVVGWLMRLGAALRNELESVI